MNVLPDATVSALLTVVVPVALPILIAVDAPPPMLSVVAPVLKIFAVVLVVTRSADDGPLTVILPLVVTLPVSCEIPLTVSDPLADASPSWSKLEPPPE